MSRYQFSSQKNIFIFIMVCMLYHKLSVGHYSLVLIKLKKKKKCGSLPLVLMKTKKLKKRCGSLVLYLAISVSIMPKR